MKLANLILLLFLTSHVSFVAAIEKPFGLFVINHNRSEYQALSQNWAVELYITTELHANIASM